MLTNTLDKATTAIAAGATASPFWLPWLRDTSEVAGLLLPIAGLAWIIYRFVRAAREKPKPPSAD